MMKRLLIANRGEIAIRVIRACAESGIESVAVFSAADAEAPHVRAADRAVAIGPPPAHDSYLSIPKLLEAARSSSADAIHHYVDAYRRYCWDVTSLADLKLAPFHLLATEGRVHVEKDHAWHMGLIADLCVTSDGLLGSTPWRPL